MAGCCARREWLTVILFIRCFGRAARRAESNERCAPTGQVDRLGPAAGRGAASADFFLAIESDDAGADHGAGGVTSSATGSSLRWPAVAHGANGSPSSSLSVVSGAPRAGPKATKQGDCWPIALPQV